MVAEGASGRVEAHGDVRRLLPPYELQQVFRKAEKDGSIHPFCINHRPAQEGIVHLEDEGVAVNQEKFHTYYKFETFFGSFKIDFC